MNLSFNLQYDELSRDEKVERTFYALEMMIHLFEVDLQMWTARHSLDPQSAIFNQSKHPLINSVLWDSSEHNQINFTIKSILKLFVNYVSIDFPKEHTHILSVSLSYEFWNQGHALFIVVVFVVDILKYIFFSAPG